MAIAIIMQLIQLISTHTGLQIREQDRKDFCNKIYFRMKILKLNTPEEYYQLLLSNSSKSANSYIEKILKMSGKSY